MKPEFFENYLNPRIDPMDGRTEDFDWAALATMLGEDARDGFTQPDFALLAETLNRLFAYLLHGRANRHIDRTIGRRVIAMIWVIRPDLINGTPSLAKIAKRIGVTRAGLSKQAAQFTRAFGLVSRAQANGWNRRMTDDASRSSLPTLPAQILRTNTDTRVKESFSETRERGVRQQPRKCTPGRKNEGPMISPTSAKGG
jgi:hypothetical protein